MLTGAHVLLTYTCNWECDHCFLYCGPNSPGTFTLVQIRKLLDQSANADERAAYRILLKALETPTRTILSNAGYDASDIMAEIRLAGPGHGFDVIAKKVVDVVETGIFDVAAVQRAAVHSAISSAALALTVDVMVHRKEPEQATQP